MKRRNTVKGLALTAVLMAGTAWAQTPAAPLPPLKAVGVFSLLGDSVQVASATDAPTDTRIERTARESLDTKGIGFDRIALRAARDAFQRAQPKAQVSLFQSPTALGPSEQRAVAAGAANAELPAWMVKTLEENKLTHLLLVTRARGPMDAATSEGNSIGRGTVEGIGFFMDTLYTMQNKTTGALSTGLLAPYMQVKLTLMDAQSGAILASYDIKTSYAYAPSEAQGKADPWNFMPAAEKVTRLREMVEQGMQRGMGRLLGAP